uniref:Solute carrier organic anion transporter family member n=1 Tax=Kryptolebias marmoratus TaxID=37003 RepID=A0A3Q2ZM20_KRYMA
VCTETQREKCKSNQKMFFAALSFAYFSKELSGSYMKSTITQLERRFDIPSYLIGIIDGSFEIGNLLVISFVSYFGAKLHRPKIIAVGCILMSLGTFLIAMPHFTCGRYNMKTSIRSSENATSHLSPCPVNSSSSNNNDRLSLLPSQESSVSLWMYVLLGNVLRGIGETPVQPLGISYIDDYAQSENAALYIGCVQTIAVIGPAFGFLLGSLCTKIYVDIGFVDTETVTITPEDGHWVGAWWLGYLIAGTITLMSAVPFWFLPKSLPVHVDKHDSSCTQDQTRFIKDSPNMDHKIRPEEPANLRLMANEFVPTLKSLLRNPVYIIYLCVTIIQFNSLIGMVTYKPKYIEQHYGQSASKANFLMDISYEEWSLFSDCNSDCLCSSREWDLVCGENGITYVSPCLAGCTSSTGSGKNMMFDNCRCVEVTNGLPVNLTATLGQCLPRDSCDRVFPYFLAVSVFSSFIISLGGTPGFMLLVRCIKPELKSLALGIYTLATRTLAGIPAPIYFGAIIDSTCLKWGYNTCGEKDVCRIYNTSAFRTVYLGLTLGLRAVSFLLCIWGFALLKRHIKREEEKFLTNGKGELEFLRQEESGSDCEQSMLASDCSPDRETHL